MSAAILKSDTDWMLSKSDISYHKLFIVPGYNQVNRS